MMRRASLTMAALPAVAGRLALALPLAWGVLGVLAWQPAQAARHKQAASGPQGRDGHAVANHANGFLFGAIGNTFGNGGDEAALKRTIAEAGADNPAFLAVTGIKAATEPCSDALYAQRRQLLDGAELPLIVSLAGSDWTGCLNSAGRSNAIERLNRLRELFFADSLSLGVRRLALTRLSATAKFRSYAENAHWEVGNVLFATINLPGKNNHFRPEAGRNSEYEDRLVANRAWLHRLFTLAERRKLAGLVLFSDGDIGVQTESGFSLLSGFLPKQDGFAEPRRQIRAMAEKFNGKVLLIDAQGKAGNGGGNGNGNGGGSGAEVAISWRGNVGHLSLGAEWAEVRVSPSGGALFTLKGGNAEAQ